MNRHLANAAARAGAFEPKMDRAVFIDCIHRDISTIGCEHRSQLEEHGLDFRYA